MRNESRSLKWARGRRSSNSIIRSREWRSRNAIDDWLGAAVFAGNRRSIGFRALHLRATLELAAFLSGSPFYDRYVHLVQTLDSPQWPSVVCQVEGCTCSENRTPFPCLPVDRFTNTYRSCVYSFVADDGRSKLKRLNYPLLMNSSFIEEIGAL